MSAAGRVRLALGFMRKSLWAVLLVAAALLLAWFRLWAPVPVHVAHVDRGLVTQEAFGRGTIENQREVAVGFDLVGRLSEVLVDEGERVTLGQELARAPWSRTASRSPISAGCEGGTSASSSRRRT